MDLLPDPPNPALPTERAHYAGKEQWDGGLFFRYAHRKDRLTTIPRSLNEYIDDCSGDNDRPWEFLEGLYPTPREEHQAFLQTWFFFGLLAEFLGLNETPSGHRAVDAESAQKELDQLYRDFVVEQDGVKHITGAKFFDQQFTLLVMRRVGQSDPDLASRATYLHRVLRFSCLMLSAAIGTGFDHNIRYSMAVLGELFSTAMLSATTSGRLPAGVPTFGFAWIYDYLGPGSVLEKSMLERGWCLSEVERARCTYQGLATLHYLSRLRQSEPFKDHSSCSRNGCVAFQLNIKTYRPLHALDGCSCDLLAVDLGEVVSILQSSLSYPVLTIDSPAEDNTGKGLQISVEPYEPGMPYVAISHVWADGMGNPNENSLPRCQIARVARLVAELQKTAAPEAGQKFRVWIDPLLCPIEEEAKRIALERIPQVYREAKHVLVLDSSLTQYRAEDLTPAEILLRTFGCSAWMRRLWTLQEGALAEMIWFQFADKAVSALEPIATLFQQGRQDMRYMRLWMDLSAEATHLRGWFRSLQGLLTTPLVSLFSLQRTLHFRTVSTITDEPLCIATMLSLDLSYVVATKDGQERMRRVWELVCRLRKGIERGIIFSSDPTLDIPGWRWAPQSLLGSSSPDSAMNWNYRWTRFIGQSRGVPTSQGLRVELPGYRLRCASWLPEFPLHLWEGIKKPLEDYVLVRRRSTGKWIRLMDFDRIRKMPNWTEEERRAYDSKANSPVCRSIHSGRCAIIYDPQQRKGGIDFCLMVQTENDGRPPEEAPGEDEAIQTRRVRMLLVDEANGSQTMVADTVHKLAIRAAQDPVTKELLDLPHGKDSQEYADGLEKVKKVMKEAMAEAWKSQPAFVQAVHDSIGPNMEEFMWVYIPMYFSHELYCEDFPSTQAWLVD